jgi:hypothetical protein
MSVSFESRIDADVFECVYVHTSKYKGVQVCKVGRSNNHKKRLMEFNNGLRHRRHGGYIDEPVVFSGFFTMPVRSRQAAKSIEREVLNEFRGDVVSGFGREVLKVDASVVVAFINKKAGLS